MECECGNRATVGILCEWCDDLAQSPPHEGHWSTFGTYWCDTCNSPYCDLI